MVNECNGREKQKILCIVPFNVKFRPDSFRQAIPRFYNLIQMRGTGPRVESPGRGKAAARRGFERGWRAAPRFEPTLPIRKPAVSLHIPPPGPPH